MNQTTQLNTNKISNGSTQNSLLFEEVDQNSLDIFNNKLQENYSTSNKLTEDSASEISENDTQDIQDNFDELSQYNTDNNEIINTIKNMFAESQNSGDSSQIKEYVNNLATKLDPEFMTEINSDFEKTIDNLDSVREKYEAGDATNQDVDTAINKANEFIHNTQVKLLQKLNIKHKNGNQEQIAANNGMMDSTLGADATTATLMGTSVSSTSTSTPVKATYNYQIGSININNNTSTAGLLSSASDGQFSMYAAFIAVLLVVVETSEAISSTQMSQLTMYNDYADYLNDAQTAYMSLDSACPYQYKVDLNQDGDTTDEGETIEIDDIYTLVSIAKISDPNSAYYDPSSDYYDPKLYQQLTPFINFMNEYYPSEMDNMVWMDPDQQSAAKGGTGSSTQDLYNSETTFSAMMSSMVDEINYCLDHVGCEEDEINQFPSTTTTLQIKDADGNPCTYTSYSFDATVMSNSYSSIQTGVSSADSDSQEQMQVVQISLESVKNWFATIGTTVSSMQSTDNIVFTGR